MTLTAAYNLLSHFKGEKKQQQHTMNGPINVSFAQVKQVRDNLPPLAGTNGELQTDITCWKCMRLGHISIFCPERVCGQHMQLRRTQLTHVSQDEVPAHWMLPDSGFTVSSVCNSALIQDIVPIDEPVWVFIDGGSQDYVEKGTLKLFDFPVYFNGRSMANILSLSEVASIYRVTMDTSASSNIVVHLPHDDILVFEKCGSGLYYFDTTTMDVEAKAKGPVTHYSFLTTVS